MLKKLSSRHLLEIFMVADITSKLWTIKKSMFLKFIHCFPNNFTAFAVNVASMREFTKINAVSDYFINFLHEITSFLTIWTADIITWSLTHASSFILQTGHLWIVAFSIIRRHLWQSLFWKFMWLRISKLVFIMRVFQNIGQLQLTMFAKQFIALSTFFWLERE